MSQSIVPSEIIVGKIYEIRGQKVMLAHDLAELYQVETKRINEQVRRNIRRFPEQYMFQLSQTEFDALRSQFATLKRGHHLKYLPYAFTEHGILMLSSVLRSERADAVNLLIIDTFVKMREMLLDHKEILMEVERIKQHVAGQDDKIKQLFEFLQRFVDQESKPRKSIGY